MVLAAGQPVTTSLAAGPTQPPASSSADPGQRAQQTSAEQTTSPPVPSAKSLPLAEFRPRSMLKVPRTQLTQATFPVVDVHTHCLYRFKGDPAALDAFVTQMDRNHVAVCVSLDGTLPDGFARQKEYLWTKYRDRFVLFANINWRGDGLPSEPATWACHQPGFARLIAAQLEQAKRDGASGLKIFKRLGLQYRNPDGSLVRIDDPRWDPIWAACGRLGLPVLIHTADPAAFFAPVDKTNERWEELSRHPDWRFAGPSYPTRNELLEARNRVIARHPETRFIAAHVANNPEDLTTVGKWLQTYPNLYVEIASRIGELGRQPYSSRRFFIQHAERILFGTDGPWPSTRLHLYWRFLETFDEYFPYSEKPFPPQGFWQIYGIGLPEDVLRKVYHENAARIVPGVRQRLDRQRAAR